MADLLFKEILYTYWYFFESELVLEQKSEILKCVVRGMIPSNHEIYQDASRDYQDSVRANIDWNVYGDCILSFFSKDDNFLATLQQVVQQSNSCYKNRFFNGAGEPDLLKACLSICDARQNDTDFHKTYLGHLGQLAFVALTNFNQVSIDSSQQTWREAYQNYYLIKNQSFFGGEDFFR